MHRTRAFCGLIAFILFISLALPSVAVADSKNIKLRAVVVANEGRVKTLGVGDAAIIELHI